jgi:guanylate kinase
VTEQGCEKRGVGIVFVVSAPSGAGKTTLVHRVMKAVPGLRFSVSYTTRPPRATERDGVDYRFVSKELFRSMIEGGAFLEWAEVHGNLYGTPRVDLRALESEQADLLLDIDTQGARKMAAEHSDAVFIFILPPSPAVLRERLVERGLDSPDRIGARLAGASAEVAEAGRYTYVLLNDDLERATEELKAIITAERCRRSKEETIKRSRTLWEEEDGQNHG